MEGQHQEVDRPVTVVAAAHCRVTEVDEQQSQHRRLSFYPQQARAHKNLSHILGFLYPYSALNVKLNKTDQRIRDVAIMHCPSISASQRSMSREVRARARKFVC